MKAERGVSMLETIVAIPVLLLLGLAIVQWALVFQARSALTHALQESAREGATGNALDIAIEQGMARGITPFLYGANNAISHQTNIARAAVHLQLAKVAGFYRLRMLSPTQQSFSDWAQPARDNNGDVIGGLIEIPNDNLNASANNNKTSRNANSGSAAQRMGYSVGADSGQSLSDANILKLELIYGVPLVVPIIGPATAKIMSAIDGCGGANTENITSAAGPRSWACPYYTSADENGNTVQRLPVLLAAQVRMQSPARQSGLVASKSVQNTAGQAFGEGIVAPSNSFKPLSPSHFNLLGAPDPKANPVGTQGFLQFGADRVQNIGVACTPQ